MSAKVTAKAVSQISEQLPSFIGEEYPLYDKFVKNYFEFLETIVVPYGIVTGYETAYTFTVGETVTGQTSGAAAVVKATGANSGLNKLFLDPSNDLDFVAEETIIGSTSSAYGSVTSITRNPVNALKLFSTLIDPHQTTEGVLEFFKKEFYPNIRKSASTDLRKFIQHLKDFYRSKGSEKSVRTLFRLLFDQENVDLYYPKTDLLKVSDGNWSQDVVLQLENDPNFLNYNGLEITGETSGSTAFVSNVTTRRLGNITIIELVITDRTGLFTIGESITATTAAGVVITATITSQLTGVTIVDGGRGYEVDNPLVITDSTSTGFGAAGKVTSTTGDQVTSISVTNPGNGYQVNDVLTFDNTGTNSDATAAAKVTAISDTYQLDVVTTSLDEFIQTTSFTVAGASVALPFSVEVLTGHLIADNAAFADATKVAEVISITNSDITIYDRGNETSRIALEDGSGYIEQEQNSDNIVNENPPFTTFVNGDSLYLFNENGETIAGATVVVIDDTSFTSVTSDVTINDADYNTAGNTIAEKTGTYIREMIDTVSTITATIPSGHNFALSGTYTRTGTLVTATIPAGHGFLGVGTETFNAYFQSGTIDGTADDTASFTVVDVSNTTIFTFNTSGTGTTSGSLDITKGTQYVTIDFADALHGTSDDNASFTVTVANSTVFSVTSTSGTDSQSGTLSLTNNANNVIKNSLVFETQTFGAISTLSLTSHGSGYESKPTATATNSFYKPLFEPDSTNGGFFGKNAVFTIGTLGGTIDEVTLTEGGFGYITVPTITCATNTSSTGSSSASLTAVMTDSRTKDGIFLDDSGKPSSIKKIQDSDYYQDYSYVIKTSDSIDVWKQDILKLIHPAGYKLFGEVAIATTLNAIMFDRGLNNINSLLENGLTQYRDLSLQLISEILNNTFITVQTSIDKEIQLDLFADNSIYYGNTGDDPYVYYEDSGVVLMEDGDKLLVETPREILNSQFTSIAQSIIEYLQTILSSSGSVADFFSLLSIKDVSSVNFGAVKNEKILLEDGDNILTEANETMVGENIEITTIQTSEPHYFHENDEIYLDDFEGTNVDLLNKKLFRVIDVDIENSGILIDSTDGTADAGDNLLLETDGIILNEDIAIFTLSDPISTTDYGTIDLADDDVPLTSDSISITSNGKIYRPSKTTSSGLPIQLLNKEYIGEYSDYVIDNYTYHYFSDDLSSITADAHLQFDPYNVIIDQNGLLLEDGDEILLEDSLPPTHASYSGTSSNLGKLIEEEVLLMSEDTGGKISLTEAETKVVLGSYLKDETTAGEDNIIFEDSGKIEMENSGSQNGVISFDQPFDYARQSGTNGFGYFKHRVEQRVSV